MKKIILSLSLVFAVLFTTAMPVSASTCQIPYVSSGKITVCPPVGGPCGTRCPYCGGLLDFYGLRETHPKTGFDGLDGGVIIEDGRGIFSEKYAENSYLGQSFG